MRTTKVQINKSISTVITWAASWEPAFSIWNQRPRSPARLPFVFTTYIVQWLYFLNPKFQAPSFLLWLYRLVCVGPGWKPRRQVFSSPEPSGSQGELIVYPCSGVRPSSVHNFKHLLLWNRLANQSQILCGASLGRGNESLYKWSRSHDQDGRHAHIW